MNGSLAVSESRGFPKAPLNCVISWWYGAFKIRIFFRELAVKIKHERVIYFNFSVRTILLPSSLTDSI